MRIENLNGLCPAFNTIDKKSDNSIGKYLQQFMRCLRFLIDPFFGFGVKFGTRPFSHVSHESPRGPTKTDKRSLSIQSLSGKVNGIINIVQTVGTLLFFQSHQVRFIYQRLRKRWTFTFHHFHLHSQSFWTHQNV